MSIPSMNRILEVQPPKSRANDQQTPSFFEVILLSDENKLELLSDCIQNSQNAVPLTRETLSRLQGFQPSAAQHFNLKDSAISNAPLRMVHQCSTLRSHETTPKINSYIALSYCWHGSSWQIAGFLHRSNPDWPISTTMLHALLDHRETQEEGIWIDQFCINQDDELDKQLAIGSMDIFYRSARKTVVILEDVGLSENERNVLGEFLLDTAGPITEMDTLAHILTRILAARWFKRAWCCHELLLSKEIVFIIAATTSIVEMSLSQLEELYSETSDYVNNSAELTEAMVDDTFVSFDFIVRKLNQGDDHWRDGSYISIFSDIQALACSSPTDVLCIAMNARGLQIYYTGSVRSENECRWLLSMVALCAGDAMVLGGVAAPLFIEDNPTRSSWLNWVDDVDDLTAQDNPPKLTEPSMITSINQVHVTLDCLDLTHCKLRKPTQGFLEFSFLLMERFAQSASNEPPEFQPHWMKFNYASITFEREMPFIAETLACSLACGFDWIIDQMSASPEFTNHLSRNSTTCERLLSPIWENLSLVGYMPDFPRLNELGTTKRRLFVNFMYLILYEIPLGDGDQRPSFYYLQSENYTTGTIQECWILDMRESGKALIAIRPDVIKAQAMVIPIALNNRSCMRVPRLWMVDSALGSPSWLLMDKYLIFTLSPIQESKNVVRRPNQVFGSCVF